MKALVKRAAEPGIWLEDLAAAGPLFLEHGEIDRHKTRVAPGETVTLLLFEDH